LASVLGMVRTFVSTASWYFTTVCKGPDMLTCHDGHRLTINRPFRPVSCDSGPFEIKHT
jgi:hypothetical protein